MTSPIEPAERGKRRSRGWSDEMDSQAISQRLAVVEQLFAAWLALKQACKMPQPVAGTDDACAKPPVERPRASEGRADSGGRR